MQTGTTADAPAENKMDRPSGTWTGGLRQAAVLERCWSPWQVGRAAGPRDSGAWRPCLPLIPQALRAAPRSTAAEVEGTSLPSLVLGPLAAAGIVRRPTL